MRFARRALGPSSSDPLEKPFVFTKFRKHLKPLSVSAHGASLLHDPLFNKVFFGLLVDGWVLNIFFFFFFVKKREQRSIFTSAICCGFVVFCLRVKNRWKSRRNEFFDI